MNGMVDIVGLPLQGGSHMPQFRADYYLYFTLEKVAAIDSMARTLTDLLKESKIEDIGMTKITTDHGSWSEISGKLGFAKGTISFYATLRPKDEKNPYDLFLRMDGTYEADNQEKADKIARSAIEEHIVKRICEQFKVQKFVLDRPERLVKTKIVN